MKKILLAIVILVFTTGCVSIKNSNLDTLIDTTVNSKFSLYNQVMRGYKYYLPRELNSTYVNEYNEILKSKYYDYYLYIDLVSYFNKVDLKFEENKNYYFSKVINHKKKKGIINVQEISKEELLVEAIYNYSKIEVKINKEDLNEVVTNCMVVLTSIKYNDEVIKNIMSEDVLSASEEQINIFETNKNNNNYLDVDTDIEEEEELPDPDVIN